jgi:hypothetical protein
MTHSLGHGKTGLILYRRQAGLVPATYCSGASIPPNRPALPVKPHIKMRALGCAMPGLAFPFSFSLPTKISPALTQGAVLNQEILYPGGQVAKNGGCPMTIFQGAIHVRTTS